MTTNTRVLSNQRITVFIGPDSGIADFNKPTVAEVNALTNVSGAVNWDGFDFNLEASDQADDRTLTDAAGAQSRQYDQFGGSISFVQPQPADTTSIYRTTRTLVKTPRTKLAIVIRTVTLNSAAAVVGDELNAYRVETDAPSHGRGDVSQFYTVNFAARDDAGINAILPSVSPTAAVLTPSAAATPSVGTVGFVTAAYEGHNVTVGATWTSSNPAVLEVSPHGAWRALAAGTANMYAQYPGGLISAAKAFTVS